jgi:hypothetical protein
VELELEFSVRKEEGKEREKREKEKRGNDSFDCIFRYLSSL